MEPTVGVSITNGLRENRERNASTFLTFSVVATFSNPFWFFFQIEFVIEILRLGSAGVSFSVPIQAYL